MAVDFVRALNWGSIDTTINDANKKISENTNSQLGSISSGMGLPPGMKLPF